MDQKEDNPLPEDDDDTKLAEQFQEVFLTKITNIRKIFHDIPPYKTQEDTIPRWVKFSTISEADLKTILNQMPTKSCEIDILNISTLKKVIDMCITVITPQSISHWMGGILCKLENCCYKTFNQIKTKRHYKIKLPTSQQSNLCIKNS